MASLEVTPLTRFYCIIVTKILTLFLEKYSCHYLENKKLSGNKVMAGKNALEFSNCFIYGSNDRIVKQLGAWGRERDVNFDTMVKERPLLPFLRVQMS